MTPARFLWLPERPAAEIGLIAEATAASGPELVERLPAGRGTAATAPRSTDVAVQLAAAEPFRRLGRRALRALARAARAVNHTAGHEIVQEGGLPLGFHLIVDGEAVVEVSGRERRRLGRGESFGLVSLLDGKPRSATVRAVTDLTTIGIEPGAFAALVGREPEIARDLLPVLCGLLRDAEARL